MRRTSSSHFCEPPYHRLFSSFPRFDLCFIFFCFLHSHISYQITGLPSSPLTCDFLPLALRCALLASNFRLSYLSSHRIWGVRLDILACTSTTSHLQHVRDHRRQHERLDSSKMSSVAPLKDDLKQEDPTTNTTSHHRRKSSLLEHHTAHHMHNLAILPQSFPMCQSHSSSWSCS